MELRVTRGYGMQNAEVRHVLDRYRVAAEVQPGVDEHGTVTCGQDETVAVQPLRLRRIALEGFTEEDGTDLSRAEGQAEVAGGALVHGVHGETTGFVGGLSEDGFVHERIISESGVKFVKGSAGGGQAQEGRYLLAQGAVSREKTATPRQQQG